MVCKQKSHTKLQTHNWLQPTAQDSRPSNNRPCSHTITAYTTDGTARGSQLRHSGDVFLFLLGEVCRNARQTSGSVHPQAASPCSPASCSKPAEHSSPPFPSLPGWVLYLLWLHELLLKVVFMSITIRHLSFQYLLWYQLPDTWYSCNTELVVISPCLNIPHCLTRKNVFYTDPLCLKFNFPYRN